MGNSVENSRKWVEFLAHRPEVPFGALLLRHFECGAITRLCDCGCNSFDLRVERRAGLQPISTAGQAGAFFDLMFASSAEAPIEFVLFSDRDGYLSGIDVQIGANSFPVPEDVVVGELIHLPAAKATAP